MSRLLTIHVLYSFSCPLWPGLRQYMPVLVRAMWLICSVFMAYFMELLLSRNPLRDLRSFWSFLLWFEFVDAILCNSNTVVFSTWCCHSLSGVFCLLLLLFLLSAFVANLHHLHLSSFFYIHVFFSFSHSSLSVVELFLPTAFSLLIFSHFVFYLAKAKITSLTIVYISSSCIVNLWGLII